MYIQVKMANGRSIYDTKQLVQRLDAKLRKEPRIRRVDWTIGESPPAFYYNMFRYKEGIPSWAEALIMTTDENRTDELIRRLQGEVDAEFPGAQIVVHGIYQGPPVAAPLEIDLYGPNLDVLQELGEQFRLRMDSVPHEMALNGAAAHAFAHIIYKALLFMSAGVVIYCTGISKCTNLGGLFRTMPLTTICGIVGALAISGFPLTSGFTTKTMISQAAASESLVAVYFLLAAASAGVFLHAGIKFPWFVFFQRDSGLRPKDAPWNMAAAMVFFASLCIFIGVFPELLYQFLPYPVDYEAYTAGKVVFYLQLLLFSGLAFFLLLPLMRRTRTISLDTDWLWRVALFRAGSALYETLAKFRVLLEARAPMSIASIHSRAQRCFGIPPSNESGRRGVFARDWSIGSTAIWITVLLTAICSLISSEAGSWESSGGSKIFSFGMSA